LTFLLLFIIPFLVALGFFIFGKRLFTWHEFLGHVGIACLVALISTGLVYCSNTSDTEIWNGRVSKKQREEVHCRHDYCCGYCESCSTDSNGSTSCYTYCCSTCYEHNYDVDWNYWTTDAGGNSISTIDRQGIKEPPRWTQIIVGEPSSSRHSFENYIKAAPDTLFQYSGLVEKYKDNLPDYPSRVFDYYRLNRMTLANGAMVPKIQEWNYDLSDLNAKVGAPKEANVIIVLVKDFGEEYFNALQQHWLGGKKNDIVVVLGVSEDNINNIKINWVRVFSWAKSDYFNIKLRDALLEIGNLDNRQLILSAIEKNTFSFFERKPMEDFEYLKASITPTTTQLIVALIINLILSVGCGMIFLMNEFTEDNNFSTGRY